MDKTGNSSFQYKAPSQPKKQKKGWRGCLIIAYCHSCILILTASGSGPETHQLLAAAAVDTQKQWVEPLSLATPIPPLSLSLQCGWEVCSSGKDWCVCSGSPLSKRREPHLTASHPHNLTPSLPSQYKLLLYINQNKHITSAKIEASFAFTVRPLTLLCVCVCVCVCVCTCVYVCVRVCAYTSTGSKSLYLQMAQQL